MRFTFTIQEKNGNMSYGYIDAMTSRVAKRLLKEKFGNPKIISFA